MTKTTYAVDDGFGTQITTGLESYDAAKRVARRYLSEHDDAPNCRIYEDCAGGESWDVALSDL